MTIEPAKAPNKTLRAFEQLKKALIDTSSIIYSQKAGYFSDDRHYRYDSVIFNSGGYLRNCKTGTRCRIASTLRVTLFID